MARHSEDDPEWPCIGFENASPARRLTEHLLMLGPRRLAVVSAPTEGNDRARVRLQVFRQALQEAGCSLPPERNITVDYGIAKGAQAFETLMTLKEPPSAILCGNDTLAAKRLSV